MWMGGAPPPPPPGPKIRHSPPAARRASEQDSAEGAQPEASRPVSKGAQVAREGRPEARPLQSRPESRSRPSTRHVRDGAQGTARPWRRGLLVFLSQR